MSALFDAAHRVIDSGLPIHDDAGCVSVPRRAWEALRRAVDDETRAAPLWRVLSSPAQGHPAQPRPSEAATTVQPIRDEVK